MVHGLASPVNVRTALKCKGDLRLCSQQVKSLLELERMARLDLHSERTEKAMASDNINLLHKSIGHVLKPKHKFANKKVRLLSEDGLHAESAEAEKLLFRDEFIKQLDGQCTSFTKLVIHDRASISECPHILPRNATVQDAREYRPECSECQESLMTRKASK